MVNVLSGDILEEIFSINEDLRRGYQLKELFLDIVNYATHEDCKEQFLCWIDLCKESKIE